MRGDAAQRGEVPPSPLKEEHPRQRVLCILFFGMLGADALAAYTVLGLPIPFLAYAVAGIGLLMLGWSGGIRWAPGMLWLAGILTFALGVQLLRILEDGVPPMPANATTGYTLFIAVRYVTLMGFLLIICFTYTLAGRMGVHRLANLLVGTATVVALGALYVYSAQTLNLWEPPRTRMGTGGQDFLVADVEFSYAFHRALGTFREPSHLAQWLAGPLLIAVARFGRPAVLVVGVFGVTLLLTGSLLGILGVVVGIGVMLVLGGRRSLARRAVGFCMVMLALAWGVQRLLKVDALGILIARIIRLWEGGILESNRGFIGDYVMDVRPPLLGHGLGNANLVLAEWRNLELVQSHLSLFVNAWFSLGGIGLMAFLVWLYRLFAISRESIDISQGQDLALAVGVFAAMAGWLVFFGAHVEELSVMFAVMAGLAMAIRAEARRRVVSRYEFRVKVSKCES